MFAWFSGLTSITKIALVLGIILGLGALYGLHVWEVRTAHREGVAQGVSQERERTLKEQEKESAIVRENRDRIALMPPDERTRLMRCIRERVRLGQASPDCERLLQGLR